jgi:hypothetical protein
VSDSYAQQRYLLKWNGDRHLLAPAGAEGATELRAAQGSPHDDVAVRAVIHLLTAWNPDGRPTTFGENARFQEQLEEALRQPVIGRAVAVPPDHKWFEEVLLVEGLTDVAAAELAAHFGQPTVIRWAPDGLTVLPSHAHSLVEATTAPALLRPVARGCPVRDDLDPTGRCVPIGGPWTSGSIHAHALWSSHRALGVQLLGCAPCANGRRPAWTANGSSTSFTTPCLGSRYGGASWRL